MQLRPRTPSAVLVALMIAAVLLPTSRAATSAGSDSDVRAGKWNKRKVPIGWVVVDTSHYQVQSQVGKLKAELIGEHLEGMRKLYKELLDSRRKMPTFVVKIFADHEQFLAYRSDEASGDSVTAWYDRTYQELVTYDTGILLGQRDIPTAVSLASDLVIALPHADMQRIYTLLDETTVAYTDDTARVLSHEAWHQYFHAYTVSWVPMPAWLDEGVGEYLYMASRPDGSGHRDYEAGAINQPRLRDALRAFEDGRLKRFGLMLKYERTERFPEASVFYAQGWAMVHFLMTHKSPSMRAVIPRLIRDFKDTKNFRKSTDKVFKDFDIEELEREWLGWLLTQTPVDPLKDLAREFGKQIKVEDLVTGKDVIRKVYMWHLHNPDAPTRVPPRSQDDAR